MEFKPMRMHCPGDENIIPIYHPEDSATDSKLSTTLVIGQRDHITSQPHMAAAPKSEGSPAHSDMTLLRAENERHHKFMTDLEDTVDWLSDDDYEEPEMNPKYMSDMFTIAKVDICDLSDLTLDKYLRLVPPQRRTSTHYEPRDAESLQAPIPPSPIPLLDTGYISPDPADVRECTRQLELYSRVAMEVQDVDAQPLYYGNNTPPGGVRAFNTRWSKCYVYLKRGETL
jgi:hypothetical protein